MTFGVRFGELVRRYRETQGISSTELAEAALGDKAKRSRLSELENGRVKNPHAKTIDKLVQYLAIPQEEIDACRQPIQQPTPLPTDTGLPKELLENLALRFGIEKPDQPSEQLIPFLKKKAKDYRKLLADLAALPNSDERVANIRTAAEDAITRGNLEEACALLDDAIEIEVRDHALESATKAADILDLKARIYLVEGNVEAAANSFSQGVHMVVAFDKYQGAERNFNNGKTLCEHGLRYNGAGLGLAIKAYKAALKSLPYKEHPENWAITQNNLANALFEQSFRTEGENRTKLFEQAVNVLRNVLKVYTRQNHPVDRAMTRKNLSSAPRQQSKRLAKDIRTKLLKQAVGAYRKALQVLTLEDHPVERAITQNNLAAALQEQGTLAGGGDGTKLFEQAVDAYQNALQVLTREDHPMEWAKTQNNLAGVLQEQSSRTEGENRTRLFEQAVDAYQRALQVRTREDHPVNWAMTNYSLANAMLEQGKHIGGRDGTGLLKEAVDAYQSALQVRTLENHPEDWAYTNYNLAIAHEALAETQPERAREHLSEARTHVDQALEVFGTQHMSYFFDEATRLRERIATKLAALD